MFDEAVRVRSSRLYSKKRVLVIVPITRHEAYPLSAVASLLPLSDKIRVLASFNRRVDEVLDAELLSLLKRLGAEVISTPKKISAVKHFSYITRHARRVMRVVDSFPSVVLCDDDRLAVSVEDIDCIASLVVKNVAVWGPFRIFGDHLAGSDVHHAYFRASPGHCATRLERLCDEMLFERQGYTSDPAVYASITGLFAPFASFRSAAFFLKATLSEHGARTEMVILASRGLSVTAYSSPVAEIRFHPSQAGLDVRELSHLRSEMRFRAYALINCSSMGELMKLFKIGFNVRWFWRSLVSICIKSLVKSIQGS